MMDQTPLYLACVEALGLLDTLFGQPPYNDRWAEAVRVQLKAAIEQHAGGPVDAAGERWDGPAWYGRPTGPGLWVCMPDGKSVHQIVTLELDEKDIKRGAPFHTPRVFGPIPTDNVVA